MRHFIVYLFVIFLGLFLAVLNRDNQAGQGANMPTVRVFGYASFTGRFGPGPLLKAEFEKYCQCTVEFIEGSDSGILLQRLKIEGESLGADVVVGLDQYDLEKAQAEQTWRKLNSAQLQFDPAVKAALRSPFFIPYDWGMLTFEARRGEVEDRLYTLDDLLKSEWSKKISLQDPRTSSPGMQFLSWVIDSKGEQEGFEFLKKMMNQVHSYSPSWSTSYGLFTNKQTKLVFTYVTSPFYHEIEEKNKEYFTLNFKEALPVQFEFLGIPEFCRHCDLAEKFVNLMLSAEGQKIIMEKNYMLPVIQGVREGTPFARLPDYPTVDNKQTPSAREVERLLKSWSDIRRGEGY